MAFNLHLPLHVLVFVRSRVVSLSSLDQALMGLVCSPQALTWLLLLPLSHSAAQKG